MFLSVKSAIVVVVISFCMYVNSQPLSTGIKKQFDADEDLNELKAAYMTARQSAADGSGVSSIISSLLGQFGTAITPSLGAFGPLATAVGPSVNNGLTSLLTNAFSGLFRIVSRGDLPISGYDTYLVNIPNQGSYILLAKSPESVSLQEPTTPSPTETASVPKPSSPQTQFIAELNRLGLNALVNSNPVLLQSLQKGNINAAPIAQTEATPLFNTQPKDGNNVMIPLSFLSSLTGNALNSLSGQHAKQMFESLGNDIKF